MECPTFDPTMLNPEALICYPCNDAQLAQNMAMLKEILTRLQAGKLAFYQQVEVLNYTGDTINVGISGLTKECFHVYTSGNRRSSDEYGISGENIVLAVPVIGVDVIIDIFEPVLL